MDNSPGADAGEMHGTRKYTCWNFVGDEDSIPLRFIGDIAGKKTSASVLSSYKKETGKKSSKNKCSAVLWQSMPFVSFFPTCMEEDIVNVENAGRLDVKIKE